MNASVQYEPAAETATANEATARVSTNKSERRRRLARTALLVCGIFSSLFYVAGDLVGGWRWHAYSYMSQAVSELTAIGAPSKAVTAPLLFVYTVLGFVFGVGVWVAGKGKRSLRVVGSLLIGLGMVNLFVAPLVPMHQRGATGTLTDIMHIIVTMLTVLLILLAIGFGGAALGKVFRVYSIATIAVLILFGMLAGLQGQRLAAGLPTPWLGIDERINIYGYLLWQAVLAVALLRQRRDEEFETTDEHS